MLEIISFSVILTLIELSGAYLIFISFKREISEEKISELRKKFFIYSIVITALTIFFMRDGVNIPTYTFLLFLEWFICIAIYIFALKDKIFQLIFVVGMEGLWVFMLKALSSMIILFKTKMYDEYLILFGIIYLIIFSAMLPIEKTLFTNIFPAEEFFKNKRVKFFVALFPMAILIGTAIPIINVTFLQTWHEKLSRFIVPFFFFLSYRSFCISMRKFEDEEREEKISRITKQQIIRLHEQNSLFTEGRRQMDNLRQDLTEKYLTLEKLIKERKIPDAMEFILAQEKLLKKTSVKKFCNAPLINAALSIYIHRAQLIGVKVAHKINLSENFSTSEMDLAVLISNLLENAVNASSQQKENRREISIIFQQLDEQCILEISNRYDFPIKLGENNLPITKKFGHGFGMYSLEKFVKKYNGYFDFSHKNNLAKFQIYWEEGG